MKAAYYTQYGPPDVIQIKDVEKPYPKENEVLIRVHASSVTAVDCTFRKGADFSARLFTGVMKPKFNIPGGELAGEIESTGSSVKLFKPGDKVFGPTGNGFGANAEFAALPEELLTLIPDGMSWQDAAAIPYGTLTALPFIRDAAQVKEGYNVLINGAAGAIGVYAVQLAKYYGAKVTGVCSTSNIDFVKSIGADEVIDYTKEEFTKNGKTYDAIFDTVGKSSYSKCNNSLTKDGKYLTTVITPGIMLQKMLNSKKAIIEFTGLRKPAEKMKDLNFIKELISIRKLQPVIDKVFPFEQITQAHEYGDKGHKKGNIVLTFGAA